MDEVKESVSNPDLTPKTNLLNTIKLPKKLIDITKRLPKANYSSPQYVLKKKVMDIKIAKGFPDIFDNSIVNTSTRATKPTSINILGDSYDNPISVKELGMGQKGSSNHISLILRNRLYKNVIKPKQSPPSINYHNKIKLPKIQRVGNSHSHNYSVNYSCRSLRQRRGL
jgi:hypothetical protein